MSRKTIDQLLAQARERLDRIDPRRAHEELGRGDAVLVDIRSDSQLEIDGHVPGSMRIPRNVLEWRLDPDCPYKHPEAPSVSQRVIVMCNEGYQSSLAAATLQELGFERATDLVGGFQAWREEGLPVQQSLSEASRLP
jgi:rhodanese-related sulfurtransferase